ncbi:hypothetical protein PsorP6_013813 [Peronosclerospora sorghi]|uniref:Uncharacterized protein n=1 Tax=Peronosclerospora sorghi TaxID=230839 RepID=A0ACC0VGR1_9STRA|nr:hypothetical protein PsorP6_013813 [Peronosclerospora sorghi]
MCATHGPCKPQTVYLPRDRSETWPVHTSWQGVPCHALDSCARLGATDAIDSRLSDHDHRDHAASKHSR